MEQHQCSMFPGCVEKGIILITKCNISNTWDEAEYLLLSGWDTRSC